MFNTRGMSLREAYSRARESMDFMSFMKNRSHNQSDQDLVVANIWRRRSIIMTASILHGSITAKLRVLYPSFSKKIPSDPFLSSAMSLYPEPPG